VAGNLPGCGLCATLAWPQDSLATLPYPQLTARFLLMVQTIRDSPRARGTKRAASGGAGMNFRL
jgi:hypothetical protein